jgi:ribosomal-protein-alanine N-acetyltransferase
MDLKLIYQQQKLNSMNQINTFQLETENLILHVPSIDDVVDMANFMEKNCDHFKHCSPNYNDIVKKSFWEEKYEFSTKNFGNKTALSLLIKSKHGNNSIIGDINFDGIMRGVFQACYLGFRLDKQYEGKGIMFEALSKAIHFIFQEWNLHRIMANFRPDNSRSDNLLKRLNFQHEGYAEKYLFIEGQWRDHIMTALINDRHIFK